MAKKKYVGTDVEYEVKPEKQKFKITRGKLIVLCIIILFIIALIIMIISKMPKQKDEYTLNDFKLLEEKMVDEIPIYLNQKQIEITNEKLVINLKDLLYENGGLIKESEFKAVKICSGYVEVKNDGLTHVTPYISCLNKYTTNGYNKNELVVTTTKKEENKDITKPVIILNGDSTIKVEQGDVFDDPFAVATDDVDGNITSKIKKDKDVTTSIIGTYIITYSVTDSAGNKSEVKRTVEVVEKLVTTTTTTKKVTTTKKTTKYIATTKKTTTRQTVQPTTQKQTTTKPTTTTKWTRPVTTPKPTTTNVKVSFTPNSITLKKGQCGEFKILPYTSGVIWANPNFVTLKIVNSNKLSVCCKEKGEGKITGKLNSQVGEAKVICTK